MRIAVIGHSQAGKDELCMFLHQLTDLRYDGSLSWHCKERVADDLGLPVQYAWDNRHSYRQAWRALIDRYRASDPACIVNKALKSSDIVCGIRPRVEFNASLPLFDEVIWVERDVPEDETNELDIEDATYVIDNNGTLHDLKLQAMRWINTQPRLCRKPKRAG